MSKALQLSIGSALFLLIGCGGGDSSPQAGGNGQTGTGTGSGQTGGNTLPPLVIEADYVVAYTAIAVNLPEGMLQIAHYSDSLVSLQTWPSEAFQLCSNGGRRALSVSKPMPTTQGSVIIDELEDCQVDTLDAVLDGKIELTITEHLITDSSETLTLDADFRAAQFRGYPELSILDTVTVTLVTEPLSRHIKVAPKQTQVRFRFSDGDEFALSQFQLTNALDLSEAQYHTNYQGRITHNYFSRELEVSTEQPLRGFLGEYPHHGQILLRDSQSNQLKISANQVVNSELANVQLNQEAVILYSWTSMTDGSYWSWPGIYNSSYATRFRHDNFNFLGMLGTTELDDFPSQGTLSYLFSRPVTSVEGYNLPNFFRANNWRYPSVGAEVTIEGALVHIRPEVALTPGRQYYLESFEAVNALGISTYIYDSKQISVSTAIKAVITSDRASVTSGFALTLSAKDSIIANGLAASYSWQELTDFGVTFSDDKASETSLLVPVTNTTGLIKIRLTVEDELGRKHSTDSEWLLTNETTNVLYFTSDVADNVGAGQTRFFFEDSSEISTSGWSKNAVTVQVSKMGEYYPEWWYLDLAAVEGQDLIPGLYQNATRDNLYQASGHGIRFSGPNGSCYALAGEFEIFEIEFHEYINEWDQHVAELVSLAVDFIQYCDGSEAALRGKVRINSPYPF